MKSSYELAMERLEKSAPTKKISNEKRTQIQEIEVIYKAKIAERETYAQAGIEAAKAAGDLAKAGTIQQELAVQTRRLEAEAEEKKEKIRNS